MAGGTWSATDMPVLPGLYLNFRAQALAAIQPGSRGVVAVPVKAHWGPVRQFVEIASEAGITDSYTADESGGATAYATLRLALLGGAKKVLAYRLAGATAQKASTALKDGLGADALALTALYEGARGNGFKVTVRDNPVDPANKKDILLYEGTVLLRTFTFAKGISIVDNAVAAINGDTGNRWITAAKLADGNGTLADVAGQAFSGGDSGITGVQASDYTDWVAALETQVFDLLALDGVADSAIQTSVVAWMQRVREEGKGVIAVLGGAAADDTASDAVSRALTRSSGWNHEGVVNVGTGAILDGVSYSSAQVAAWVAGLVAGQKLTESPTYAASPFADVTRRWTRSEMEQAVQGGVLLLFHDGRAVKVLRGVNTLVSLREGQGNAWKKIRAIRVMDAINADLVRAAEDSFIGKVNNTEEGRLALIGACKEYMRSLASAGVIEDSGWDVYLDPDYYGPNATKVPEPDQVYIRWEARLTDVVEQIFGTFVVK